MSRRLGGDSYRPYDRESSPHQPAHNTHGHGIYYFGGRSRGRGDFSFRPRIAERDLLKHIPSPMGTPVLGLGHDGDKFRDVTDLTDSDEEPMDEDSDPEEQGRSKRRRLDNTNAVSDSKPKWSNPDPYTSLPPQDSNGKHIDVVKLIRKARNDVMVAQKPPADQDDFISFDSFDDPNLLPPSNAPRGPKVEQLLHSLSPRPDQALGKRKRTDDYEDNKLLGHYSRGQYHANGAVLAAWRQTGELSPTPWLRICCPNDIPIVALHKEILDFYAWVRPHEFEFTVREDLINRLSREINRYKPGELKSFGSYAAGLYLPTGDMDLVFMTKSPIFSKNDMFKLGGFLERHRLAVPGSVNVIAKARVPIIKFVDSITGLKVDLSFNNTTGVVAIDTFKQWQVAYPALPVIVAVVKQFLMIRGLNDNAVGGFGGFANICMVTGLIQNLPSTKSQNLGELLLEFFNLFGNLFDIRTVGLRMDPPGFIDKRTYTPMRDEKPDRLMIVDPNRADNNITGGSDQVARIFHLFSKTYDSLLTRLDDFRDQDARSPNFSFLSDIIGGNFTAYYDQRRDLRAVYQRMYPNADVPPPPPPPITKATSPPPPPPPPLDDSERVRKANKRPSKSEKLFERVKRLCPELQEKLSGHVRLATPLAVKIGGWKSKETMESDLNDRQSKAAAKLAKVAKSVRK